MEFHLFGEFSFRFNKFFFQNKRKGDISVALCFVNLVGPMLEIIYYRVARLTSAS